MVVEDRLTELAFFLPLRMTDPIDKLVKLYVKDVVRLHGVLISIMSDRDPRSNLVREHIILEDRSY